MANKYLDDTGLAYFWDKIKTWVQSKLLGQNIWYGTSATGATTQTKVVTTSSGDFALTTGAMVRVKFTNANTYNGTAKLKVDDATAINITRVGTTATTRYFWSAGEAIDFVYDGTNFVMARTGIASTTYYGLTKYSSSAVSTSEALSATPKAVNGVAQYMISGISPYSSSDTYAVGDLCRYGFYIYRCITAITTAEAWTAEHWEALPPLLDMIDDKADASAIPTKTSDLTNDSNFVSDSSYVHTDNNFTTTLKNKLDGIASGAQVNQNAFSGVKVGPTTIYALGTTDTFELDGSGGISMSADVLDKKIMITGPSVPSAGSSASDVGTTSSGGSATTWSKSDHVHGLSSATIASALGYTPYNPSNATQSSAGLMSASDKTKLDGISPSGQIQADWDETDTSASSYIRNKPTSLTDFTNDAGYLNQSTLAVAMDSVSATVFLITGTDSALSVNSGSQTILGSYTSGLKCLFVRMLNSSEMRAYQPINVDQATGEMTLASVDDSYIRVIQLIPYSDTSMVGSESKVSLSDKHPIGSVYITGTNSSPASYLGGTWTLIDKEFTPTGTAENVSTAVTINTTNANSIELYCTREGHNLLLSGILSSKVSISNTNLEMASSINLSALGASALTFTPVINAQSDSKHAIIFMDIDKSSGRTRTLDVVVRGTGTSITATTDIVFQALVTCDYQNMVDSFCNRFYWKRTA